MNLQMDRIQQACEKLNLSRVAIKWSAIADVTAGTDKTLADFFEQLLDVDTATEYSL